MPGKTLVSASDVCGVLARNASSSRLAVFLLLGSDVTSCKTTQLGLEYTGKLSHTRSGRTCKYWGSTTYVLPESESNYCRNPDETEDGPWCYTIETSGSIWGYCDVPYCNGKIYGRFNPFSLHDALKHHFAI